MSTKKNLEVIIVWEDELRLAGIKINELIKRNNTLADKDDITDQEKEEYLALEKSAISLCYSALNGINDKCAIALSRKPSDGLR